MPPNRLHQGKYRHLANLDLADFFRVGDDLQIDALISSDHYWQLVTGKVIQEESGPTAFIPTWVGYFPVLCVALLNRSVPLGCPQAT